MGQEATSFASNVSRFRISNRPVLRSGMFWVTTDKQMFVPHRNLPYVTFIVADSDCNYGLLSHAYQELPTWFTSLKTIIFKSFQICYGRRTADDGVQSGIVPSGRTQTVDALKMSDLC
ncbi:hypothetical protein OUZ56_019566 [Daphnia magna]|uniref:Uncharacterized protein n=1 Tax=Daphnia magna TaxID=35525 RepID=A0ABQ9ZBY7_9CRUS|nr:hypothetical protein OUZ56_019566 [Daphnia magna]